MILEIATEQNNEELIQFYSKFPITGHVELKPKRLVEFTTPYAIQSDKHLTFMMRDQGELLGCASFVIRDVYLNKKITTVAMGRDLRIEPTRRAITGWTQHFLPVMQALKQDFKVEQFFSTLNMMEIQALNTFVRPRATKRPLPRYFLFRRFNMVTAHGQLPWVTNPLPHLKIRHGATQYIDALTDYVIRKSLEKDLSTVWDAESFSAKISRWRGMRIDDFLIAFDKHDNVIGCMAPWSAENIQELVPTDYSMRGHNFRQFLKFGNFMGWTRPMTKPSHRLKAELPLYFKYISFLHADNEDIFEALMLRAYEEASSKEFLVYGQMLGEHALRAPRGWICSNSPYGIYNMVLPTESAPEFLRPTNERIAEVEPFFI